MVIKTGSLRCIFANGRERTYGDGTGTPVTIKLHDRLLELQMLLRPKLYVGEGYMDGRLTVEEGTLFDFLEVCAKNLRIHDTHPVWAPFRFISNLLYPLKSFNPVSRAQKNVAHHYDLSSELYDLFLDEDRQYSCAYFDDPNQSLDEAQYRKKQHLAAKLLLDKNNLKILDIGSGWGGLGLYLAQVSGAQVTGLTLSKEQHEMSNQRAEKSGLASKVKFHLRDYRLQEGTFDRIVSVGMFEHVGPPHFRAFFKKTKELLTDDGVALLHFIGRNDPPGGMNPWILKYIFPGGYIPALSEVMAAIEKEGLYVTDIEVLRLHYAETLRNWRLRFDANRQRAEEIYDERFCRMWEYYLSGCELSFRYMGEIVFQIQYAKDINAVPLQRDYITDWERGQVSRQAAAAE